jgi:hypothetical protein
MRDALQSPVEKLEQMGRAGAFRVAQQHNAAVEASKLGVMFQSNINQLQDQATIDAPIKDVREASIHTARSN